MSPALWAQTRAVLPLRAPIPGIPGRQTQTLTWADSRCDERSHRGGHKCVETQLGGLPACGLQDLLGTWWVWRNWRERKESAAGVWGIGVSTQVISQWPSCSMRLGQNRKALPPALFGNVDLTLGEVTEEKLTVPYTPVWWGEMWPSIFTYMKKNVALLGNPCNK